MLSPVIDELRGTSASLSTKVKLFVYALFSVQKLFIDLNLTSGMNAALNLAKVALTFKVAVYLCCMESFSLSNV